VNEDPAAAARDALDRARLDARADRRAVADARRHLAIVTLQLSRVEAALPLLRARVRAAYEVFTESAVELYAGSSPGPAIASDLFDGHTAIDVGRATTFASTSTMRADQSFDALRRAQRGLEQREQRLQAQKRLQRAFVLILKRHATALSRQTRIAAQNLRRVEATQDAWRYFAAVDLQNHAYAAAVEAAVSAGRPVPKLGRRSGPAVPDDAAKVPVEQLICPVDALVAFRDDWTQPRGSFRVHEGNDILAARGSPNVALTDGIAVREVGGLGGNAIHLIADNGDFYFYGHLDHFAGKFNARGRRRVHEGDVVGYSGNTGNAAGGPVHTHFEIHPASGPPLNPYHVLTEICAGQLHGRPQIAPGKYD
jgi:murein DD-endopeptidase MepM/ murein hydrolase activator NlpD